MHMVKHKSHAIGGKFKTAVVTASELQKTDGNEKNYLRANFGGRSKTKEQRIGSPKTDEKRPPKLARR